MATSQQTSEHQRPYFLSRVNSVFANNTAEVKIDMIDYDAFQKKNGRVDRRGLLRSAGCLGQQGPLNQLLWVGDRVRIYKINRNKGKNWEAIEADYRAGTEVTPPRMGVVVVSSKKPTRDEQTVLCIHSAEMCKEGDPSRENTIFGQKHMVWDNEQREILQTGDLVWYCAAATIKEGVVSQQMAVSIEVEREPDEWHAPSNNYTPEDAIVSMARLWQNLLEHESWFTLKRLEGQSTLGKLQWVNPTPTRLVGYFQPDTPTEMNSQVNPMKVRPGGEVQLQFVRGGSYYALVQKVATVGEVEEIQLVIRDHVALELAYQGLTADEWNKVVVTPVEDEAHMKRIADSVKKWTKMALDGPPRKRQIMMKLLGRTEISQRLPQPSQSVAKSIQSPGLPNFSPTDQQVRIATLVIEQQEPVVVIEGPPGTGKTNLIAGMIQGIIRHDNNACILACAPSHRATDNLAAMVWAIQQAEPTLKMNMLRVETAAHELTVDTISPWSLGTRKYREDLNYPDYIGEMQAQVTELWDKLKKETLKPGEGKKLDQLHAQLKELQERETILENLVLNHINPNVVFTTCFGAGDHRLQGEGGFTHIIIDEVGQATQPEVMFTCQYISRDKAMQVILVGDRNQLPPVVRAEGKAGELLETCVPAFLEKRGMVQQIRLQQCFRMHPALLEYPNLATYNGELRSAIPKEERSQLLGKFPFPNPNDPRVFVTVEGGEQLTLGHSRSNPAEAAVVVSIVRYLMEVQGILLQQIGVLSFYDAQRRLIISLLQKAGMDGGTCRDLVANVDAFQGQERELIILSCVRSINAKTGRSPETIGFIRRPHRANVAITRARQGLIIVGNPHVLDMNWYWRGLAECMDSQSLFLQDAELEEHINPALMDVDEEM